MKPIALALILQAPNFRETWIGWFTSQFLHNLILVIVVIGIAATVARFIVEASRNKSETPNIRALAAAILPMFAGIWIFMYWRSALAAAVAAALRFDAAAIGVTLSIGLFFSFGFRPGSPILRKYDEFRTVLGTFLSASLFTISIFAYPASQDPGVFRLYYALAIGVLLRLTLFGVPLAFYRWHLPKFGTFEIRSKQADEYLLYIDDKRVKTKTFHSPKEAAEAVSSHNLGHSDWDNQRNLESPDIGEWETVSGWGSDR